MPSTYAGLNVYHASIVVPSDGDPAVAESVNVALRALADDGVFAATQLTHQAFDDRGKISTITGDVVLNDGGGSLTVQIDTQLADVAVVGLLHIYSEGGLWVNAHATFMEGVNFDDVVVMSSSLDVRGEAEFHSPVQLGFDGADTVTIGGDLVVNNQSEFRGDVQLGFDTGDQITVGGLLVANQNVTLNADLITKGDTHFGNAGADTHEFDGNVTMHDGLVVGQDVTVEGDLNVEQNLDVTGTTTLHGEILLGDDVTIGGGSSDDITVNGRIISPVSFHGAGRVGYRYALLPNANLSVTVAMGNLFFADLTSGPWGYTISDSGAADGDFMIFVTSYNGHNAVIGTPDGKFATLDSIGCWVEVVRMNGTWYYLRNQKIPPNF
jgi:hypothetical protein